MFYFIVSKLPIISKITDDSKLFKIFVIGTMCYIILHAFLFSKQGDGWGMISSYRNYIYYLAGIDLVLTGAMVKLFQTDIEYDSEDTKPIKLVTNQPTEQTLTREEMLHKLEEVRKQNNPSLFIKHDAIKKQQKPVAKQEPVKEEKKPEPVVIENPPMVEVEKQPEVIEQKEVVQSDTEIPVYESK